MTQSRAIIQLMIQALAVQVKVTAIQVILPHQVTLISLPVHHLPHLHLLHQIPDPVIIVNQPPMMTVHLQVEALHRLPPVNPVVMW